MKISAIFTCAVLIVLAACEYNPFNERLASQGLLGSHFGVPGLPGSFDYVILGGGTAGLAMARRLAENTSFSVAVIEAGDFYEFSNGNLSEIPADASAFIGSEPITRNPLLDWYQFTTPQPGLNGRAVFFPTGKVLGGSSARNFLWHHRSSRGAYQKWADLTGDAGFQFDNLLPYFIKSTTFTPPDPSTRPANSTAHFNETVWSTSGGPVQVSYPSWVNGISSWIGLGLSALGLEEVPGLADGNIFGWGYTGFSLDPQTQTRSSSETSYLRQALLETTNLLVYKNTIGKRVLFDKTKRATGVIVESGGISYQLNATKEVIISCGAFRSPQMLMVSGVGPQVTLQALGIPVISDLPGVGKNMWDHIAFSPSYVVNVTTHSQLAVPAFSAQQTEAYIRNRTGQLTNPGGDILGFAKLPLGSISNSTRADLDNFASDWPDIEHLFLDAEFGFDNDTTTNSNDLRNYVSSSVALTNPFSRGNVTIISNDTATNPIVSPNWLTDPRDQEIAVAAFKQARAVFTNNASSLVVIGPEVFPGLDVSTDAQILNLIGESAAASYHASCTCAMGLRSNPEAVLDSNARVYGVQGLRVVDASAFPVLPPGHPHSTIYALAEKVSDAIMQGN